jgi:hypothetical protein
MKDRDAQTSSYTQIILTLITVVLIVLALRLLGTQAPVMVAAAAQGQPSEGQVVRIPRDWRRLAGVSERRLFFEAEDGTIRQMPVLCEVCTFFRNERVRRPL